MDAIVFGDGPLGRAITEELQRDGWSVQTVGRPDSGSGHRPEVLPRADAAFDASRGGAVWSNVTAALGAGCRRFVLATTGWDEDRDRVQATLAQAGASAVAAPNLSIGAALFLRLVESAAEQFAAIPAFEPFIVEWHRRDKRDRPSGTARALARRIDAARRPLDPKAGVEVASIRAGSSPGSHLVGFDAAGETVELRLTARDRSSYAAGAVAAANWLLRTPREPGIHRWDAVVDELLAARTPLSATA